MIDHEFVSELMVAFLHGPQNKKDRLDFYYRTYEESFEDQERLERTFSRTTAEIEHLIPSIKSTRWRKKSDFYTLFLLIATWANDLPWSSDVRMYVSERLLAFAQQIDGILALDPDSWDGQPSTLTQYAKNVARAASDRGSRIARTEALEDYLFTCAVPDSPIAQ